MPIYLGNTEIGAEYVNNYELGRIYQGTQVVQLGYSIDYATYAYYDASNSTSYPGSGSTWFDLSGNGNHLTLTGSVSFTSSYGGLFNFSGSETSTSAAVRNNPSTFNTESQVTFIAWFNPQRNSGFSGNDAVIVGMPATNGTGVSPELGLVGGKALGQISYTTATTTFFESGSAPNNTWHMRAVVSDSTGSTRIWTPQGVTTNSATGSLNGTYFKNIMVGGFIANSFSDNNLNYSGSIAQVVIYNRALTDSQILDFYEATKGKYGY